MVVEASRLLAAVAEEQGIPVQRLSAELVLCGDRPHQVLCHGFAGAASGKAAHVLCGEAGWLRAYLTRAGLPVAGGDAVAGDAVAVAVVAGEVVATVPEQAPEAARSLAVRAVAALPGTWYAAVRVFCPPAPEGTPVIEAVDPALGAFAAAPEPVARRVAAAILAGELGAGARAG